MLVLLELWLQSSYLRLQFHLHYPYSLCINSRNCLYSWAVSHNFSEEFWGVNAHTNTLPLPPVYPYGPKGHVNENDYQLGCGMRISCIFIALPGLPSSFILYISLMNQQLTCIPCPSALCVSCTYIGMCMYMYVLRRKRQSRGVCIKNVYDMLISLY